MAIVNMTRGISGHSQWGLSSMWPIEWGHHRCVQRRKIIILVHCQRVHGDIRPWWGQSSMWSKAWVAILNKVYHRRVSERRKIIITFHSQCVRTCKRLFSMRSVINVFGETDILNEVYHQLDQGDWQLSSIRSVISMFISLNGHHRRRLTSVCSERRTAILDEVSH